MHRYFTADHEWFDLVDNVATVGITDHAQSQLGDIVFIDLPQVGATFEKGDTIAVIESVKAASDIYNPLSGIVLEVNETIAAEPTKVNSDAEGSGWLFRISLEGPLNDQDLMNKEAYLRSVE